MGSFIAFTLVAIVAHVLVWFWRPWLPGEHGYAMLIQHGLALTPFSFSQFS